MNQKCYLQSGISIQIFKILQTIFDPMIIFKYHIHEQFFEDMQSDLLIKYFIGPFYALL